MKRQAGSTLMIASMAIVIAVAGFILAQGMLAALAGTPAPSPRCPALRPPSELPAGLNPAPPAIISRGGSS
jgi:hypothetical protein